MLQVPSLKRVSYIPKNNAKPRQQSKNKIYVKIVTASKYSSKKLHLGFLAGF